MSALTPPRADLRGGNQSADSFATSRSIFTPSTTLCFFARRVQAVNGLAWYMVNEYTYSDLNQGHSRGPRDLLDVAFETWFCFRERLQAQLGKRLEVVVHEARAIRALSSVGDFPTLSPPSRETRLGSFSTSRLERATGSSPKLPSGCGCPPCDFDWV